MTEMVETAASEAFANIPRSEIPHGWPNKWNALPAFLQNDFRTKVAEFILPTLPVVSRYADQGMEHAMVLRGRIEMLIEDLKARESLMAPSHLAAELEKIINEQMETL